jgi:hypothetical protein
MTDLNTLFDSHPHDGPWPEPTTPEPTEEDIRDMVFDAMTPEATDGCPIEPDGVCQHGHPSWLLQLGLI